jgi:hypothetical protein
LRQRDDQDVDFARLIGEIDGGRTTFNPCENCIMTFTLTAFMVCLVVGQDDAAQPAASLPPIPYRLASPVHNDAGVLLYHEMRRRLLAGAVPITSPPAGAPLLNLSQLEPGDDASTQIAVELLDARLRLAELDVVATRENPERIAVQERVDDLQALQRRLRRRGRRPDRWLLARNRERLLDQLEVNLARLLEVETRNNPQRRQARRLAVAYARLLR